MRKLFTPIEAEVVAVIIGLSFILVGLSGCASIPFIKPLPPCDPSRFDMTTFKGKMAHYWCEVKQDAKKL